MGFGWVWNETKRVHAQTGEPQELGSQLRFCKGNGYLCPFDGNLSLEIIKQRLFSTINSL